MAVPISHQWRSLCAGGLVSHSAGVARKLEWVTVMENGTVNV